MRYIYHHCWWPKRWWKHRGIPTIIISTNTNHCTLYWRQCWFFLWQLMESLNLTLVVGLSVDYVVHLAEGYSRSTHTNRLGRLHDSLAQLGISVLSGACTTIGGSAFLLLAEIILFLQFGVFMFATILFSVFFALCFFSTLLGIVGPEGECGSIQPFKDWLRKVVTCKICKKWRNHHVLLMCQVAQHITADVHLSVYINAKRTKFLGVLIDEHVNQVPHINNENCQNCWRYKARFPWSVFLERFRRRFCLRGTRAEQALVLKKKTVSHYEHSSCFHRRGLPRRLSSARTK